MLLVLSPLFAAPASGETPAKAPSLVSQHASARGHTYDFRLSRDQFADQSVFSDSAFGPETSLSAGTTLGFGFVRAGPKMANGRLYGVRQSHSAAFRFRVKF